MTSACSKVKEDLDDKGKGDDNHNHANNDNNNNSEAPPRHRKDSVFFVLFLRFLALRFSGPWLSDS